MLYNIFWIFCLLLSRKSRNFVALLWFLICKPFFMEENIEHYEYQSRNNYFPCL